jgi:hypothetical protein
MADQIYKSLEVVSRFVLQGSLSMGLGEALFEEVKFACPEEVSYHQLYIILDICLA